MAAAGAAWWQTNVTYKLQKVAPVGRRRGFVFVPFAPAPAPPACSYGGKLSQCSYGRLAGGKSMQSAGGGPG